MTLAGEKRKDYKRNWIAARRRAFFHDKKCVWCGSVENLELHHIDPKEKIANAIWSWAEEKRLKEIAKCIVLCKICHRGYHNNLMRTYKHGTATMYKRGCRCDLCKKYENDRHKEYRRKLKDKNEVILV